MEQKRFSRHTVHFLRQIKKKMIQANKNYRTITKDDYQEVKTLCSICKFERGLCYKKKRNHVVKRARSNHMLSINLTAFLSEIKNDHNFKPSQELKVQYETWNKNEGDHKLQISTPEEEKAFRYARNIMQIANEWLKVVTDDTALLFYLETPLSENTYNILKKEPLKYRELIEELELVEEELITRTSDLKKRLTEKLKQDEELITCWWAVDLSDFKTFIRELKSENLLLMKGKSLQFPYRLNTKKRGNITRFYEIVLH
ncbi:MAG: hypothetical protein IJ417_07505, partial [Bacteroidaceae bacterium]|nr:hypothetical protein [Bacteroidaceae bacterium]